MFPALDGEVVQIVLEHCGGDVERALDQLLSMAAEQSASMAAAPAPRAPASPRAAAAPAGKRWRRPLPEDFLRLPPEFKMSAAAREQSRNDELFARMLANEGFRAELARHDEFRDAASRLPSSGGAEGGSASSWSNALGGLSEAAQTKLAALATRWQLGQQQQQQQLPAYSELGDADEDDDPYLNSLMPSGGAGARAAQSRRGGADGDAVELGEMASTARAKRP
jgi:hypothetical protein